MGITIDPFISADTSENSKKSIEKPVISYRVACRNKKKLDAPKVLRGCTEEENQYSHNFTTTVGDS